MPGFFHQSKTREVVSYSGHGHQPMYTMVIKFTCWNSKSSQVVENARHMLKMEGVFKCNSYSSMFLGGIGQKYKAFMWDWVWATILVSFEKEWLLIEQKLPSRSWSIQKSYLSVWYLRRIFHSTTFSRRYGDLNR